MSAPVSAPPARHALFATDFDRDDDVIVFDVPEEPEAAPEPAAPPPGPEDVAAARIEGFEAGLRHGRAEAAAAQEAQRAALASRLVGQLAGAADGLQGAVDAAGERIARLAITMLDRAFPAMCARFGPAEVARFTRQVIALLEDEPRIVVRMHPTMADALATMLAGLEPAQRAAVLVEPDAALAPGDALVGWRSARARRSALALWADLREALAQLGLGPVLEPPSARVPPEGAVPDDTVPDDAVPDAAASTDQPRRA